MMQTIAKRVLLASAIALTAACASHDYQDTYLLGASTELNIATQSVRDVNLPNSKAVESSSGVRAAKAVKALNEGKTQELRQQTASAGGES